MPLFTYNDPTLEEAAVRRFAPGVIRVWSRAAGGRTVLFVAGEVDLASVGVLRSEIAAALESDAGELWIDLCKTEFIDSSGLHLLVETARESERLHRRLAIVCPPGPIRRVIDIAGLADMLPLHGDAASAERCA